jgi:hypothetical protein
LSPRGAGPIWLTTAKALLRISLTSNDLSGGTIS